MGKIENLMNLRNSIEEIACFIEEKAESLTTAQIDYIMTNMLIIKSLVEQANISLLVERKMRKESIPESSEKVQSGSEKPAEEDYASEVIKTCFTED